MNGSTYDMTDNSDQQRRLAVQRVADNEIDQKKALFEESIYLKAAYPALAAQLDERHQLLRARFDRHCPAIPDTLAHKREERDYWELLVLIEPCLPECRNIVALHDEFCARISRVRQATNAAPELRNAFQDASKIMLDILFSSRDARP